MSFPEGTQAFIEAKHNTNRRGKWCQSRWLYKLGLLFTCRSGIDSKPLNLLFSSWSFSLSYLKIALQVHKTWLGVKAQNASNTWACFKSHQDFCYWPSAKQRYDWLMEFFFFSLHKSSRKIILWGRFTDTISLFYWWSVQDKRCKDVEQPVQVTFLCKQLSCG